MSRGPRTRIGAGIYSDASGIAAVARVGFVQREKRFPTDVDLDIVTAWQRKTKGELLVASAQPQAPGRPRVRDAFARAVVRYLRQLAGRPGAAADRAHLAAWVERFSNRARSSITAADVRLAFAAWRVDGQRRRHQKIARPVSPQTLRHRYRVLKKLYRVLDGPLAPTPCDTVPRPNVPQTLPQDVDIAVLKKVAGKLRRRDALTYARFLMLATTGKAPAELKRATLSDFNLKRRTWFIRPAKGRRPQLLHLNAEMIEAIKIFKTANAWGEFDSSRYAKVLRRCGWPEHIRPYNVRHALAIELLRRGGDLGDIQAHLGHASIETTRRFYAGLLEHREKVTSRRLEGRLGLVKAR